MYTNTILASVAVMASTALASTGSAHIINACSYPVYFLPVPASGGGYDVPSSATTLAAKGGSWTQPWTSLTNGAGWSLKLAKDNGNFQDNILQYEYTFQNDGTIWYDLSCVNGNPWDGNWEVTASGDSTCIPKQSFYRFATDDAYGMQSCPADSSITVTLCSGEDAAESIVSSIVAAVTAQTSTTKTTPTTTATPVAATTTTHATSSTPTTTHTTNVLGYSAHFYNAAEEKSATTFATSTTAAFKDEDGHIVTVVETVVETAIAYETYVPGKRHVHHPEHPHFR